MSTSPVAKEFADAVAPALQSEVASRREAIVAGAGGVPTRVAMRLAFPVLLREVPHIVEAGANAFLDRCGGMSIAEIASMVLRHRQAQGREAHPSVLATARRGNGPQTHP